jgi:hypothetical protein
MIFQNCSSNSLARLKRLFQTTLFSSIFLCLPIKYSYADTFNLGGWDITGFGTIGYAETDKYNDLVLKRNITQKSQTIEDKPWLIDSRLGLQARKELNPGWDAIGQIVAQEKVDNSLENAIEMAFRLFLSLGSTSYRVLWLDSL